MTCHKGDSIWLQAKASYLHFKGKDCCMIIARDLKSINKQNAIIQMTQANLEDAERIAKIGSWRVNMLNWSNWWSKGNFAIYGLDVEKGPLPVKELIKKHLHPDDGSQIMKVMKSVLKTGKEIEIRIRVKDPDEGIDGYRHLLTRVRPFYINGKLVEVKGTNMDINDLVKAQLDLEAKNIHLQNLNDKLSDYAFKNAHELRGPLSAMLGVIELMKAENYGELVTAGARSTVVG